MFGAGQLAALLVVGMTFGLIVQSYAKKKGMKSVGTIGLIACIATSFIGAPFGLYWLLALPTMIFFLAIISGHK
jgi:hypothetical protein